MTWLAGESFLQGCSSWSVAFSNESSNCLQERMHSYIDCICLAFLHCAFCKCCCHKILIFTPAGDKSKTLADTLDRWIFHTRPRLLECRLCPEIGTPTNWDLYLNLNWDRDAAHQLKTPTHAKPHTCSCKRGGEGGHKDQITKKLNE